LNVGIDELMYHVELSGSDAKLLTQSKASYTGSLEIIEDWNSAEVREGIRVTIVSLLDGKHYSWWKLSFITCDNHRT
jgi:hypothetical protein